MSEKKGFFKRLAQGLSKTRDNIASSFDSIFSGFSGIDEDFYEELEEILIMSDMGIDTTMNIIEDLKKKVKEKIIYSFTLQKEIPVKAGNRKRYFCWDCSLEFSLDCCF